MLVNLFIGITFLFLFILLLGLFQVIKLKKNLRGLMTETNVLHHDINAAWVTLNLTLESLKDIVLSNQKKDAVSHADLPSLIDVLEEIQQGIGHSIHQWNTQRLKQ